MNYARITKTAIVWLAHKSAARTALLSIVLAFTASSAQAVVVFDASTYWSGTYTSSVMQGDFLHTETNIVNGLSVSGTHTFDSVTNPGGNNFGIFTWSGTLAPVQMTTPYGSVIMSATLSGTGTISDYLGTRSFTISAGGLDLNYSTGTYDMWWLAPDSAQPGWQIGGGSSMLVQPAVMSQLAPYMTSPVPEPREWLMLLAGFGLMGFIARRKNRGNVMAFA